MDYEARFPDCRPAQLLGLFTEPTFLDEFALQLTVQDHHTEIDVQADRTIVDLLWRFGTERAPSIARPFVPKHVELTWQTTWTTATGNSAPGSPLVGTFEAACENPAVTYRGDTSLRQGEDGAVVWRLGGVVSAKRRGVMPGATIAGLLGNLFTMVLDEQVELANTWLLARPRSGPA